MAFFFHFISNIFRIILPVPNKQCFCNASIVKSKSNFSIHFSKCFVTASNAPITTGITSTFLIFSFSKYLQFQTSAHYSLNFSSSFFTMRVSNGHAGSISMHFLFFLSITVISGRLCSRALLVCIGKSHKILQFSDSKTFSGLCIYQFSALLNPYFSHSFP